MEMTPVDFVAAAILHLASETAQGGTYHLANPDPPPADEVFDRLEEQGYPLERLPYEEWLQRIDAAPPEAGSPGEILQGRSEEHTSELQSRQYLVCRLLLEKKKNGQHAHAY